MTWLNSLCKISSMSKPDVSVSVPHKQTLKVWENSFWSWEFEYRTLRRSKLTQKKVVNGEKKKTELFYANAVLFRFINSVLGPSQLVDEDQIISAILPGQPVRWIGSVHTLVWFAPQGALCIWDWCAPQKASHRRRCMSAESTISRRDSAVNDRNDDEGCFSSWAFFLQV